MSANVESLVGQMGQLGLESRAAAAGGVGIDGQLWQQARMVVATTMAVDSMCDREYEWWTLYTYQVISGKVCPDA
eukprot:CAMPEP_0173443994 /NCGR_PEP_ID=MMETSP1357-20121228/31283_1 /TAXON_ID=77926 /ORGANISM="Hemiselmis rufescens, Strain PCC563" /LENGTH=74 /DNA_ID=CAMNT_0014409987 /DNA_START=216 /DNA_END=436 /DNA_ORIENTATION=-